MPLSKFKFSVLVLVFVSVYQSAFAFDIAPFRDLIPVAKEDFIYANYFTIQQDLNTPEVNLLNFQKFEKPLPLPAAPYNRREQFGTWINPKDDGLCMNVRHIVLVRDADANVTYSPDGCSVQAGAWNDPYTAKTFETPQEIQIDHFVPLKNAYMTGAHEWSADKRCLYSNYMGNDFHLLAVSARENLSKSDGTPNRYTPPNKNYVCQYLKQWLAVKAIWNLRLTPPEASAVENHVVANNCDVKQFKLTASELASERLYMESNKDLCSRIEPPKTQN